MAVQIPLSQEARATEDKGDEHIRELTPDVAYRRLTMVNIVFVGLPGAKDWVLIDAGLHGSAPSIIAAATARFGADNPPAAILMTHAHFDHVGALVDLLEHWNCPVYAHALETPYLTGQQAYPPPDAAADGGIIPKLSPLFPRDPIDVSRWLRQLPEDGSVPPLPGWQWVHTPGHTTGHISLWRQQDRLLIAGDAVITTGQESAYEVVVQEPEMHGPPRYLTPDWVAAEQSVRLLASLEPDLLVTGHGRAMQGAEMTAALHQLADNFRQIAVPRSQH
ncbi:MBL fold metallo-hydrolase [Devosia submarina]|uniref:MBL fold metallo-hydrolase n=1 Tax=Devosia submarina TaxID=1173082 RepID=UPI000D3AEB2C|nr:MBL fold metallo-hydrolase [Devosia submarina]